MDPASLAIAATVGSSAIQGIGAIQQSQASAAAAGYNAKVAGMNAQIATQNANLTGAEGEQNVGAAELKTKAQVGGITANQGASGEEVNTGSAVNVRESAAQEGMLNALNVRSQAARAAYGYQTQAAGDVAQAGLYRSEQSADKTAGFINAGADILGGAGKAVMFSNYLNSSDPTSGLTNAPTTEGPYYMGPIGT